MDNDLPPSPLEVGVTSAEETSNDSAQTPASETPLIIPENPEPQLAPPFFTKKKKPGKLLKILIPILAVLVIAVVVIFIIGISSKPIAPTENPDTPSEPPTNPDNPDEPDDPEASDDVGDEAVYTTWTDNREQNITYAIKFNPKTGKFYLKESYTCIAEECEDDEYEPTETVYAGTFPTAPFERILSIYEDINFENENADLDIKQEFFHTLALFAGSQYEQFTCLEATGSDDPAACVGVDTDGDGIVSRDELGVKALNEIAEKLAR